MSSWTKEKGVGAQDLKGKESNSQEEWKDVHVLVNKCLVAFQKQWDIERTLIKQALLGSSLSAIPRSYYNIVIYGSSSLPGCTITALPAI